MIYFRGLEKMKKLQTKLVALALMIGMTMIPAFAQIRRGNDRQIRTVINSIELKSNSFKNQLNNSLNTSSINNSRSRYYINETVSNFESSTNTLKQNFNSGRDISNDVRDVLAKASSIDNIMRDYRFNTQTQNAWNNLKTDLNKLSGYYSTNWNWNNPNYPGYNSNSFNGTFRLNASQSDDLNSVIDRSLNSMNNNQRERMRNNLQRRLAVPEYLTIERFGNSVRMASSNASQTTIQSGSTTERLSNGRNMTNTVTLSGNRLTINSDGDQVNAFYISFEPYNNGQNLKVTRRLNLENRGQTITVVSVYDRTSTSANWNLYQNNGYPNNNYPNNNYPNNGNNYGFIIQNGTQLTATLNTELSTKGNFDGQRFSMTVTSPSAYYGAIIEGNVSRAQRSGKITGRPEMSLDFDTIKLRNGRTYRFEGLIDRVTTLNGKTITIDNENAIKGGSQTTDTVVRTGVGGAIGAIIGGIAGGGKGAAIGAAIGAGAGGGSILIQGRDDIELKSGTTFNITSSSNVN